MLSLFTSCILHEYHLEYLVVLIFYNIVKDSVTSRANDCIVLGLVGWLHN